MTIHHEKDLLALAQKLEEEWVRLLLAGDSAGLARYLDDDFLLVTQQGSFFNKADFLKAFDENKLFFENITVESTRFQFYTDAFLAVRSTKMKMRFYGRHFEGVTVIGTLWSKRSGDWQIGYVQSTDSTIMRQWQDLTSKRP